MKSPATKKIVRRISSSEEFDEVLTQQVSQKSRSRKRKRKPIGMPKSPPKAKAKPEHISVTRLRTFIDQAVSSPDTDNNETINSVMPLSRRVPKRLSQLPCSQHSQSSTSRFHHPYSLVSASGVWSQIGSQDFLSQGGRGAKEPASQPDGGDSPTSQLTFSRQSAAPVPDPTPRVSSNKRRRGNNAIQIQMDDPEDGNRVSFVELDKCNDKSSSPEPVNQVSTKSASPKKKPPSSNVPVKTYLKKHRKTGKLKAPQGPQRLNAPRQNKKGVSQASALATSPRAKKSVADSVAVQASGSRTSSKILKKINVNEASPTTADQGSEHSSPTVESTFDKIKERSMKRVVRPSSSHSSAAEAATPVSSKKRATGRPKKLQVGILNSTAANKKASKAPKRPRKQQPLKNLQNLRGSLSKNKTCKGRNCGPPPCSSGCPRWKGDCKTWLNTNLVSKKMLETECSAAGIDLSKSERNSFLKNANNYLEDMFDELSDNTPLAYGVFSFQNLTEMCNKKEFFQGRKVTDEWLCEEMKKFVGSDEKLQRQAEGILYPSAASRTLDTAQNFDNC